MKSISVFELLMVCAVTLVTSSKVISQESKQKELGESPLPLGALIEVKPRMQAYMKARNQQIGELASKYERVIESRFSKAASAGDLKMAKAFQVEKERIGSLVKLLAAEEKDPVKAAQRSDTLPDFPSGTSVALVDLRKIWTAEWQKIRIKIDGEIQQSLKALEIKFTKARDIENAEKISVYRKSLLSDTPAAVVTVAEPATKTATKTEEKDFLIGKTISYQHDRNPDFIIRVVFKADGQATWIGLGNFEVPWNYEMSKRAVFFYWMASRGKEAGGYTIKIDPDGKTGTVTNVGTGYTAKAKIKRSRR